jgi:hypothetical protein
MFTIPTPQNIVYLLENAAQSVKRGAGSDLPGNSIANAI